MSEPVHLLVVADGVDRSEAAIFAGLQRAGLRLRVLHAPEVPASASAVLREAGIPAAPLKVRHRLDFGAVRRLRRELAEQPCDLVYAPINRTLAVALLATRHHQVPVIGYRGTTGHLSRWDPASWLTYFHPRLSHVVCVSEAVREYLLSTGLPPARLTRIYKGHDPAWYAPREPDPPLPVPTPGSLQVCFAGRIRPVKGIRYLLDALRWIPPEESVTLVLAGSVDEPAVRRRLARGGWAHRVVALGHRRDATALIGKSDILVMPSVAREGLPRAVVEAMAQGVPVVASGVGGLPEIVLDGETGLIVPPRDARALAAGLRRLRGDPALRARLGAAGRRRVDDVLHVRQSVAAYDALFRRVAGR